MSLKCILLGHNYQVENTEQREKVKDDKTLLVDYKIKVCSRCSKTKEEKVRTKIRNEEDESQDREETTSRTSTDDTTNYAEQPTEPKTRNSQGGVVLKGKDHTGPKSKNQNDSPLLASDPEREFVEEDGAVLYKDTEDGEVGRRVKCGSCDYSELSYDCSRRTGDLCTECGGWLEVEVVHGKDD
jgi:hypothetical protein